MKKIVLLFTLLFIIGNLRVSCAQKVMNSESFSSREGIDIENIKSIVEDNDGFVWISGEKLDDRAIINKPQKNYIQRFDGERFRSIYLKEIDSTYLMEYLYKQPDGKISIHATSQKLNNSIFTFDPSTFKIISLSLGDSKSSSRIFHFDSQFYLLTQNYNNQIKLNRIRKSGSLEVLFEFSTQAINTDVSQNTQLIKLDNKWIVSGAFFPIMTLSETGEVLHSYSAKSFNRRKGLLNDKIRIIEHILIDNELFAIIDKSNRLYRYDPLDYTFKVTSIKIPSTNLSLKSIVDPYGNHLISSSHNGCLSFYQLLDGKLLHKGKIFIGKTGGAIQLGSSDLNDHVWVAINKNEVHYFKFASDQFLDILPEKQLRAINNLGNDEYLIATENNGWYLFNEGQNKIEMFPLKENGHTIYPDSSRNFICDGDTIWSNARGSIIEVNKRTGNVKSYRHYPVTSLIKINDSLLLYTTNNYHLMSFNIKTKQHVKLLNTNDLTTQDLAYNPKTGNVLLATNSGLLLYNLKAKFKKFYVQQFSDPFLLMVDYAEEDGFLIGSRKGKIFKFDESKESFSLFYKDALKAGIATITKNKNSYWINTFNGLVHYNPLDKSCQRYSVNDGLSNNEGNRYSACKTNKGILVGSIKGLNYFDPDVINSTKTVSILKLLKLRSFDKSENDFKNVYECSAFGKADIIHLPAEHRSLEIEFALSNVDPLRGETYRYRLIRKNGLHLITGAILSLIIGAQVIIN